MERHSTAEINAEFACIISGVIPDDEPGPNGEAPWFVLDRAEAERYVILRLRDAVRIGDHVGFGEDWMGYGLILMSGQDRTLAVMQDGSVVPWLPLGG